MRASLLYWVGVLCGCRNQFVTCAHWLSFQRGELSLQSNVMNFCAVCSIVLRDEHGDASAASKFCDAVWGKGGENQAIVVSFQIAE